MNLKGTKKLLDIAKGMANLKSFVHVSTAYSNCQLKRVEEKTYKCEVSGTLMTGATGATIKFRMRIPEAAVTKFRVVQVFRI